jgi:hypothetical protein
MTRTKKLASDQKKSTRMSAGQTHASVSIAGAPVAGGVGTMIRHACTRVESTMDNII